MVRVSSIRAGLLARVPAKVEVFSALALLEEHGAYQGAPPIGVPYGTLPL
jgi:hypothetical protein